MLIRPATLHDVPALAGLRAALWPDAAPDEHREELLAALAKPEVGSVAFIALANLPSLMGFAEAAPRQDYVNGCKTSPVAFFEGVYVKPEARRTAVGQALAAAVEAWGRDKGCSEFASDALLENRASHAFHAALGFKETERVVYFRKAL